MDCSSKVSGEYIVVDWKHPFMMVWLLCCSHGYFIAHMYCIDTPDGVFVSHMRQGVDLRLETASIWKHLSHDTCSYIIKLAAIYFNLSMCGPFMEK